MENDQKNGMFNFWKMQQLVDELALSVEEMREEESKFQSQWSRGTVTSFTEREALEENRLYFLSNELPKQDEKERDITAHYNHFILCQTLQIILCA